MPDPIPLETPVVEIKTATQSTTTSTGPQPPMAPAADDSIRKWLAWLVLVQFAIFAICLFYFGESKIPDAQMLLGAQIAFVSSVLNYFFGSSSGSASKEALLAKKP